MSGVESIPGPRGRALSRGSVTVALTSEGGRSTTVIAGLWVRAMYT